MTNVVHKNLQVKVLKYHHYEKVLNRSNFKEKSFNKTFDVILNNIKYSQIHNVSIHLKFYQNIFITIFLNFHKDGKEEFFLWDADDLMLLIKMRHLKTLGTIE